MKKFFNKNWPLIILIVLAIFTRFWHLTVPAEVVFDEVHFGKFVSSYFNHEYYFDIHPPLGKMMIAAAGYFLDFNPGFDFKEIGEALNAKYLFALRFLPALFGVIFIVIIYQLLLALNLSRLGAFAGAFLVLFENSILVESRFILVDIFLLSFGFASLYFFILFQKSINRRQIIYLILTSVFAGLAYGIKFTGLSFLGLELLFSLFSFYKNLEFKKLLITSSSLIFISLAVYISVFPIHFALLDKSGAGDAYMSAGFQKSLTGNKIASDNQDPVLGFWGKLGELNKAMFNYSAGLTATHPDGSKWYEWPVMKKSVYYWVKSGDGEVASIYLIGNPLVWWSGTVSVILAFLMLFIKRTRNKLSPEIYILLVGYLANFLPFVFVSRVAFLYHYLIALVFSILIHVFLVERLFSKKDELKNKKPYKMTEMDKQGIKKSYLAFYLICLMLVFVSFLLLSPLTYGLFVSSEHSKTYSSFINFLH